jgi:hypothetical protein
MYCLIKLYLMHFNLLMFIYLKYYYLYLKITNLILNYLQHNNLLIKDLLLFLF